MVEIKTIKLKAGGFYTPQKGEPPVMPCYSCPVDIKENCGRNLTVCDKYIDYEHAKAVYRLSVFG